MRRGDVAASHLHQQDGDIVRMWEYRRSEHRGRLRITGRRLLIGDPQSPTHRGWLARHGGRDHDLSAPPEPTPAEEPVTPDFALTLTAGRDVSERMRREAVDAVVRVARFAPRPVLHARVAIRVHHDPALARPAVITASLDVSGRIVRAHATAAQLADAIDLMQQRLRRNLERLDERRRARRRATGVAEPGHWRHGDLPGH
ncbi:MAG: HPF/RaiA family ribosome-associated protein [Gaiellaceae bacterium]